MKNIQNLFRIAANLCNGYRDTLLYTVAAIGIGLDQIGTGIGVDSPHIGLTLICRETARLLAWQGSNHKNLALFNWRGMSNRLCVKLMDVSPTFS